MSSWASPWAAEVWQIPAGEEVLVMRVAVFFISNGSLQLLLHT